MAEAVRKYHKGETSSMTLDDYFLFHLIFLYALYLYIRVAFAMARTLEVAHGKIPSKRGGELIFEHVVITKFARCARTR